MVMIHGVLKGINNMIKKRMYLFFVRDEILELKVVIYIIKYIKRIYLYLMNIQYMVVGLVLTARQTTHLIDTYS